MSKLSLSSLIRMDDGAVLKVSEALDNGLVRKGERFHIQNDESHGNIVGLPPRWRTQSAFFRTEDAARQGLASYRGGARLVRFVTIESPTGDSDWGHLSQHRV